MRNAALAGLMALMMTPVTAALVPVASVEAAEAVTIHAPGPSGQLEGVLVAPSDKGAPVALIIPGSGPTDRDGNSPLGVSASMYRLLAEGLASRGIATVRADKRGMFGSRPAVPDAEAVTIGDYAVDVRSWARAIRERAGARCIWLIGHSEGGLVALVAAQTSEDLCGLVLLATPGRRIGDVLKMQLSGNPANAPLLLQAFTAIESLEAGNKVDMTGMHPALLPLFRGPVQGFLIDLFSHDPTKLIASVQRPVLIVQGGRDLQVAIDDARALEKANPSAKLVILPSANHVFKDVSTDDIAANFNAYSEAKLPLSAGLVDAIAMFVLSVPRPK